MCVFLIYSYNSKKGQDDRHKQIISLVFWRICFCWCCMCYTSIRFAQGNILNYFKYNKKENKNKTVLQLQVHMQTQQDGKISAIHSTITIIKREGILALYNGLTASLLRQLTYSTTRFGAYEVHIIFFFIYLKKFMSI